jgi:hypothetical protein
LAWQALYICNGVVSKASIGMSVDTQANEPKAARAFPRKRCERPATRSGSDPLVALARLLARFAARDLLSPQ